MNDRLAMRSTSRVRARWPAPTASPVTANAAMPIARAAPSVPGRPETRATVTPATHTAVAMPRFPPSGSARHSGSASRGQAEVRPASTRSTGRAIAPPRRTARRRAAEASPPTSSASMTAPLEILDPRWSLMAGDPSGGLGRNGGAK